MRIAAACLTALFCCAAPPSQAASPAESGAFLAKAEKEADTIKLSSGVLVQTIKKGEGATPTAASSVSVNYRGTTISGIEFDSSYNRGRPSSFSLSGVIPCWTQGIQKMQVGGKAKLICPADTAYGESSPTPLIPPGSVLVFEVELLGVE